MAVCREHLKSNIFKIPYVTIFEVAVFSGDLNNL